MFVSTFICEMFDSFYDDYLLICLFCGMVYYNFSNSSFFFLKMYRNLILSITES